MRPSRGAKGSDIARRFWVGKNDSNDGNLYRLHNERLGGVNDIHDMGNGAILPFPSSVKSLKSLNVCVNCNELLLKPHGLCRLGVVDLGCKTCEARIDGSSDRASPIGKTRKRFTGGGGFGTDKRDVLVQFPRKITQSRKCERGSERHQIGLINRGDAILSQSGSQLDKTQALLCAHMDAVALRAHALRAQRACEEATELGVHARAALYDARAGADVENVAAWGDRLDAFTRSAIAAAETAAIHIDAALERDSERDSERVEQIATLLDTCEGYCRRLRTFAMHDNARRILLVWGSDPYAFLLATAARDGDADLVELLLCVADPAAHESACLQYACAKGHAAVVHVLLADGRATPTNACFFGFHAQVVQMLLQDGRANPQGILSTACSCGAADIVQMLLQDGRADPTPSCLLNAAYRGHADVVCLLLEDARADLDDNCLTSAAHGGHVNVVRALLQDSRTNPQYMNSVCLRTASTRGKTDVVRLLLEDGRANPAAFSSECLLEASAKGNAPLVQLLLKDGRADPTALYSHCLKAAARGGYADVVRLLLQDRRADPSADQSFCLRVAKSRKHADVIDVLQQDGRARIRCLSI